MFYFLVIIGVLLIGAGLYKEKGKISLFTPERIEKKIEFNELNRLKLRIENIENILFLADPVIDVEEEISFESVIAENDLSEGSLNTYKIIRNYEKENYSLEEICSLLNMKKGEVLLLKNLYKNYPL